MGYAIGEVVLVVIGIVLALQIDEWYNEQNLRRKERVYLTAIRENLEEDLENVQYSQWSNRIKDSVITNTLHSLLSAETETEAMQGILRNMQILADFSIFTQNRVAFDNMLSAENIDLVSQDSLRLKLSIYYSVETLTFGTQDRVKELTRNFVDHMGPLLMNRETIQMMFGKETEFISVEDMKFTTNQQLFGDLFSMQRTMESHSYFLQEYEQRILDIIARIDRFLGKGP